MIKYYRLNFIIIFFKFWKTEKISISWFRCFIRRFRCFIRRFGCFICRLRCHIYRFWLFHLNFRITGSFIIFLCIFTCDITFGCILTLHITSLYIFLRDIFRRFIITRFQMSRNIYSFLILGPYHRARFIRTGWIFWRHVDSFDDWGRRDVDGRSVDWCWLGVGGGGGRRGRRWGLRFVGGLDLGDFVRRGFVVSWCNGL